MEPTSLRTAYRGNECSYTGFIVCLYCFAMSCDRTMEGVRQDECSRAEMEQAGIPDGMLMGDPKANSTVMGCVNSESGFVSAMNGKTFSMAAMIPEFTRNDRIGQRPAEEESTMVEYSDNRNTRRQPKLTEKGKAYQFTQKMRERKRLKREIGERIANIETLMELDKNLDIVNEESVKLNERFKYFGDLHEDIQELMSEFEREEDSQEYDKVSKDILKHRSVVKDWMLAVNQRQQEETISIKSRASSKCSKSSRTSTASNTKALEAKARHAEIKARLAQFEQVKEAERSKLVAECAAAAVASGVYEEAANEENEQYLGSDDPDAEEQDDLLAPSSKLNPKTDMYVPKTEQPKVAKDKDGMAPNSSTQYTNRATVPGCYMEDDEFHFQPLRTTTLGRGNPQAAFLEKMELRMSQPPPKPCPFDGDPAKYLRFSTNFKDQVENKASLTDSEKMSYLMSYTTGKAREVIENYQGLPNGCKLALQVLKRRFGQTSMIVQALKSSVTGGPKISIGDNAALLALSDQVENCCWAMAELHSNELDCTTNLRQIYDHLPDPL